MFQGCPVKDRRFSESTEEIPAAEVRSHLEKVLSSPQFRSSKRCHRFLTYVVSETIEGKGESLKERIIATEVFDRSPSWDSGEDTIVRGGAREVRKRLAQYYCTSEGMQERIRIELPPGSYAPLFTHPESITIPPPHSSERTSRVNSHRAWFVGAAAILLMGITAVVLPARFSHGGLFDEFWAPVWHSQYPALIAIAQPLVYHPSSRATRLNDKKLGPTRVPIQRALQLPPNEIDGSDMIPVPDQYVGYGDTVAVADISVLLGKHSQDVRLRSANEVEFADFRDAPSALIGAFTNRWTMELTEKFPFHFGYDAQGVPTILDSADPSRRWSIPSKKDNGAAAEDYFIVCRLANSPSGKLMIVAGGLAQFGTEAAGRFLVDPGRLSDTLQKLGKHWQNRNFEAVFHAKVVGNSPSAADLIAWRVW